MKLTGSCPLEPKLKIEILLLDEVGDGLQQESISCLIRAAVPPSSIIDTWKEKKKDLQLTRLRICNSKNRRNRETISFKQYRGNQHDLPMDRAQNLWQISHGDWILNFCGKFSLVYYVTFLWIRINLFEGLVSLIDFVLMQIKLTINAIDKHDVSVWKMLRCQTVALTRTIPFIDYH